MCGKNVDHLCYRLSSVAFHLQLSLHHGFIVRLRCMSTGRYLRIMDDGSINGEGGEGELSESPYLLFVAQDDTSRA